ncbi:10865_t:CDS:2 [Paraglomus brasilianum]|uniref:10865_t:CDS:1 n=1 Tax=Paraglomus brasilianum TaxID=144538 RepID=A0A9N8ZAK5_9GLOM|nr:10865_t:CDS:2 [Paraglomus brasilianum]
MESLGSYNVNPLRSIACEVFDMSGSDNFWFKMLAENQGAECLNPPDGYASLNTHGAIRIMYQELMNNCRNSSNYDAVNIIRPVTIPTGVGDESVEAQYLGVSMDYAVSIDDFPTPSTL